LAIDSTLPGFGSGFVAIALFFFAFTTIMSYYFQAETNLYFLFRKKKTAFYMINLLRIAMLLVVFFAAVNTMTLAWAMADMGVGMMAWLNLIAILLLGKVALKVFKDFEKQYKSGIKEPVFHPKQLGIENTDVWESE
jgi:AGCS family alanine or glycine:cation symporter